MDEPDEWWGPDLTHPKDGPERHALDEFGRILLHVGRRIDKKIQEVFGGLRAIGSVIDETENFPGARHKARRAARNVAVKSVMPISPRIEYPTSSDPFMLYKQPKINTRPPKMRYRNRR